MTQGWADDALNAMSSIDYRDDVGRLMGEAATDEFLRLFMAPGMNHCGGGPGPNTYDALSAMERWIRDDVAPASIVATHVTSGRTRPLCAYPSHSIHRGQGSIDDAASFFCTASGGAPGTPAARARP
jgi:feruloyl esterase